jgi:Undecaprenyl-phosphate glucose phosphotransferase
VGVRGVAKTPQPFHYCSRYFKPAARRTIARFQVAANFSGQYNHVIMYSLAWPFLSARPVYLLRLARPSRSVSKPMRKSRQAVITTLAPLVDGLIVACASWLAYFTRWMTWNMSLAYVSVLVLGTGLVFIILPASGAYKSWRDDIYWHNTGNALPGLCLVAALLMLVGTLTKTTADYSRLWMAYWFAYALTGLFLFRWMSNSIANFVYLGQPRSTRILIVGEGTFAHTVAQKARDARDANWEIAAIVSPYGTNSRVSTGSAGAVSTDALEAMISDADRGIDEVWIAMDNTVLNKQEAVIRILQTSSLTVRYVPDLSMLALLNHVPSQVAGMTVIDLNTSPMTGLNSLIKTVIDKLIAVAALALLAPIFMLIALAIKLDSPGPVFFLQKRHGWDGKVIRILKFRTMNHAQSGTEDSRQAQFNDPRTTAVGRFLRKTSLDELPQFINVLRGDMSVVGPRPHPLALNHNYAHLIDTYMQRHRVKPGITGWAQIHGFRGETECLEKMLRRVEYDLYYIQHWSLWMDIKIIVLTIFTGWTGKNAY